MPAADLEAIVEQRLRALLQDEAVLYDAAAAAGAGLENRKALLNQTRDLARR